MNELTKEGQVRFEDNIRALKKLIENQLEVYLRKCEYENKSEIKIIEVKKQNIEVGEKNISNNKAITGIGKVIIGKNIQLDLPAVKRRGKFELKHDCKVYIKSIESFDGKVLISGVVKKKLIYTAVVGRLPVGKYTIGGEIPFNEYINVKGAKKGDRFIISKKIEVLARRAKPVEVYKDKLGNEIAKSFLIEDLIEIWLRKI